MSHTPILLVEDDRDIREILAETLTDRGFDVAMAENGLEGLEMIRASAVRPAAILLDLMMPVMDGYAFLEELRNHPSLASIPVVVITAGYRVQAARLGRVPVVPKPIDLEKLLDGLEELGVRAGATG